MRLGIRAKLVGTLLLAGLLPLALALAVILIGAVELRISSRGQMYRALAQQQAGHLSTILASQVELANLINGQPGTVEFLTRANKAPPLAKAEIDRIEAAWPMLRPGEGLLRECLENDLAKRWQAVARTQRRFSEAMVTDATGRLVAATDKTTDYYQADEAWWQNCYDNGNGRVLISDVVFDESAIAPGGDRGTLVADLCLPIYDVSDPARRKVIGVTKVSIDATWMLQQADLGVQSDELPRATWLVSGDGRAVRGATPPPPVAGLPDGIARRIREQPFGWLKDDGLKGYELVAFATVEQSKMMEHAAERWHVVVATSLHDVVSPLYRTAWLILSLGLAVIALCFIGGWVIARREIIRPLKTLEFAVNQLKAGHRDYRLDEARGGSATFRDDEIGQLAHDFNVMADQLEGNLEQMEHADEMKRQFIDLASHELRTPVTYILGASQLGQRMKAGANGALSAMLLKISAKAQRLNRIVENMFKLLASDRFDPGVRMTTVDVAALVRAVCQEDDPFLLERRQRWQVEVEPDLPTIQADADKVRDILSNLVSNAIRFSPDGGTVGVRASRVDDAVEIVVSDSGPGIPPRDIPGLFQPFFTGAGVAHHSSGDFQHMSRGIGLGLSVVKRFVDLHHGAVTVDTSPSGTAIRVRLPIIGRKS